MDHGPEQDLQPLPAAGERSPQVAAAKRPPRVTGRVLPGLSR
jgi:hypothetical protein